MEIRLENVSKSYDRPVLKSLNYRFESGRLYVIKGVSGCGKSTLLNIIGGVEKKYEGRVMYGPKKLRSAYIFQRSINTLINAWIIVRNNMNILTTFFTIQSAFRYFRATLRAAHIKVPPNY